MTTIPLGTLAVHPRNAIRASVAIRQALDHPDFTASLLRHAPRRLKTRATKAEREQWLRIFRRWMRSLPEPLRKRVNHQPVIVLP